MKKILSALLAIATLVSISSCVKEEEAFTREGKTPLESPEIVAGELTSSSISFYWTAVENAGQYTYKVVNPAGYIVAKGETTATSVFVKGLKFGTTFKVFVSAIPEADFAKTMCSSEYGLAEIKTEDPIIIDYEWVLNGYAWFYADADTWNKTPVTVGLEKGTGHFVITSYCGAEGFDFYFDLTAFDGTYPFVFDNSMKNMKPVEGQAIDTQGPIGSHPDFYLAHGLGGKAVDYNVFYGDGMSYEYGLIDTTGGYIDFWTTNFDSQWCGYRVEFGDYKAPEPEPWTPDPDMAADWSAIGEINFNGEGTKSYVDISFDAESGEYTVSNWYGAEEGGYDLVFTRDAEKGTWIIDNEKSSAFASACPGDGLVGYLHGTESASKLIWIKDDAESGLEGTDESGQIWIDIINPDGEEVRYSLVWPAVMFTWTKEGSYYSGRHDSTESTTLSYNVDNDTYTLIIPQYGDARVDFQVSEEGAFIPVGGDIYKSDDTWWYINYADTWVFVNVPVSTVDVAAGKVVLDVWNGSDRWTDTFTWAGLPGVDSLVGTYAQDTEGWWWDGANWVYPSFTDDVTITAVDAKTIQIVGLLNCSDPIIGVVDAKAATITMAPNQPFEGSFFFKAYSTGGPVTASYDSGIITFNEHWSVTDEAGKNLYWDNIITVLTKK